MKPIRSFIAFQIKLSPELKNFLFSMQAALSASSIRWVNAEQLHVTLAFLGETSPMQLVAADKLLGSITGSTSCFTVSLRGLGYFGKTTAPRVIWIGMDHSTELGTLQKRISEGLVLSGMEPEDRQYSPHITLGRIKEFRDAATFRSLLTTYGCYDFHSFSVEEIIHYESILSPGGPEYRPIRVYPLLPAHTQD